MVFLVNLARVVFAPLIEPLSTAFAVDPGALGVLATAAWLGSALPRLPTGWLLTRVPRHHVVLGAGTVLTAASGLAALAPTLPLLVGGAFLMGLASGAYFVAANPLVSELFPDRVGRVLGIHGTAAQVAAVIAAPLVTAVLVLGSWRLALGVVGLAAAVATVGVFLTARRAALPDAGSEDRDLLGAARAQWRVVLTGVVVIGSVGFVWNGLFNFYPTYLERVKGLPAGTARNLLTVVFAAGVPAFLVTGRLADRVPSVPLLLAIVAAFVGSVVALTAASGLLALVVTSAVLGYAVHSLFPAVDTYMLGSLPDHHRASAYTVYSATMMLVQAGGSLALGTLLQRGLGFDQMLLTAAGGLAVVLVGLFGMHLAGRVPAGHVAS